MRLKELCPTCHKEIKNVQSQFTVGNKLHYVYNCGHLEVFYNKVHVEFVDKNNIDSYFKELIENKNKIAESYQVPEPTHEELYDNLDRWIIDGGSYKKSEDEIKDEEKSLEEYRRYNNEIFHAVDGSKDEAYRYQKDGVFFIEKTQLKGLIADGMGVGKTIQALMLLKRNKTIVFPCLILVKGATVFQWAKEFKKWVADNFSGVVPITDRCHIIPGFQTYIMSQDFLSRKGVLDAVAKLGIKCVIVDECQGYKNPSSARTRALISLIQMNKIEYRIALSGTPIKNKVSEYFTILNLLDPRNFDSEASFKKRWLVLNEKGVYTRLNPVYADKFKELTGKYIIRREKHDVLKDLPPLTRDYQLIEIEDPYLKNSYNHELGVVKSILAKEKNLTGTQILGMLAKLRQITGMAKASYAVEWTNEFLESSEDSLSIAIHHNAVKDTLYNVFTANNINPLKLSGEDNVYAKERIVNAFNGGQNRVLIINALAGGVGLNLQSCANALILERQWNSADEEQFEGRFHRDGQKKGVTVTYLIAKGTIDEFFHDLVFKKRNILAEAGIGNPDEETNSISFLKEFAEFVVNQTI